MRGAGTAPQLPAAVVETRQGRPRSSQRTLCGGHYKRRRAEVWGQQEAVTLPLVDCDSLALAYFMEDTRCVIAQQHTPGKQKLE